jgi:2-polyprenyl-3-methyl-5-hydroxy-6-metoxy-1,4-benzoquinol methylase
MKIEQIDKIISILDFMTLEISKMKLNLVNERKEKTGNRVQKEKIVYHPKLELEENKQSNQLIDGFFDEEFYLKQNKDVKNAVNKKRFKSGYHHFKSFGFKEGRMPCHITQESLSALMNSDLWPEAVSSNLICNENSEEEKEERAETIVDWLELQPTKFLDFGCGEGHVAKFISQMSQNLISVGYDLVQPKLKGNNTKLFLTNNFNEVKKHGPYDTILLYDILDHSKDPLKILNQVKSLLQKEGKAYIRIHPWCSRHGGHLYRTKNKAFIHLIEPCNLEQKITNLDIYQNWIEQSDLHIIQEDFEEEPAPKFLNKCKYFPEIKKFNINFIDLVVSNATH